MYNTNDKMPIILIGNSFKYEIEATCKLFFNAQRFLFSDSLDDAVGDRFIVAGIDDRTAYADIKLSGKDVMHSQTMLSASVQSDRDTAEHELCRLIYNCLSSATGIRPPWGLMTGIRPVKKVIDLMRNGFDKAEIFRILTDKYSIAPDKLSLAYETAVNQLPILDKIDPGAVSLYVSIPFCPTRCSYCSFVSHSMGSAIKLMPEYVEALCRELRIIGDIVRDTDTKIDTIYFGGGTPTSISAEDLRKIMETVEASFNLDKVREYSVEAGRPDTITPEKLHVIKSLGAERISVNPQTLNDDVLRAIGRAHSGKDAIAAFEAARKEGFKNINTDLIAGLPTESADSFKRTLEKMIELSPESITVHALTLKRAASLFDSSSENICNPAAEMVDHSIDRLISAGYLPYYMYRQKNTVDNLENVGYARSGFECYYNIFIMDETQTILGAGCAASTKLVYPGGKISRIHNYKFPYEYIKRFDELMGKKTEVTECLKRIRSINLK